MHGIIMHFLACIQPHRV